MWSEASSPPVAMRGEEGEAARHREEYLVEREEVRVEFEVEKTSRPLCVATIV